MSETAPYKNEQTENLLHSDFSLYSAKHENEKGRYNGPEAQERKEAVAGVFQSLGEVGLVGNDQEFRSYQSMAIETLENAHDENEMHDLHTEALEINKEKQATSKIDSVNDESADYVAKKLQVEAQYVAEERERQVEKEKQRVQYAAEEQERQAEKVKK